MHDPTQKDMQYPDVGTQYRSEIFYENDEQKKEAEEVLQKNKLFNGKIETNISKISNYCKAEEVSSKIYRKKSIMKHLVTTDWLKENLDNVRIFDASWHLPNSNRNDLRDY